MFNGISELKGPVGQILQVEKNVLAVEQNKALMPPSFNKTVTWGFADHSLRLAQYETDKPIVICESSSQSPGEIVTCVCPTSKTVITAGTSTVINDITHNVHTTYFLFYNLNCYRS